MHENWRITHYSDQKKIELLKVAGLLFKLDLEETWSEGLKHRAVLSWTHFGCMRIGESLTTRTTAKNRAFESCRPTVQIRPRGDLG